MIKILLAVDIFDQSNPPDCDMQAPFWAPAPLAAPRAGPIEHRA